jgi:5'-3' exonuclease
LTNADTKSQITKNQAIRLIEDHGTLSAIFDNIGKIKSKKLRDKLSLNRKAIETTFNEATMGERTYVPAPKDLTSPAGFEQIQTYREVNFARVL